MALCLLKSINSGIVEFDGTHTVEHVDGLLFIDPFNKNPSVFEFPDQVTVFSMDDQENYYTLTALRTKARHHFETLKTARSQTWNNKVLS